MKRFWQKVNGGLLLGGVLLLGLIAFLIFKELQFRTEIPQIRDAAREAIEDLLELNCFPEDAIIGKELTKEQQTAQMQRFEHMLSESWDVNRSSTVFYTATDLREAYQAFLSNPLPITIEELSLSLSDNDIYVSQNGADFAKASITVEAMSAVFYGDGNALFYGDQILADSPSEKDAAIPHRGNYCGYFELELHRGNNGAWTAVGIIGYISLENEIQISREAAS